MPADATTTRPPRRYPRIPTTSLNWAGYLVLSSENGPNGDSSIGSVEIFPRRLEALPTTGRRVHASDVQTQFWQITYYQ